jgi:hypothetical protein
MVYAAVKCRVIVYRGYGKAVVGLRGAMHLQGLPQTRGKYESHARCIARLVKAQGCFKCLGVVVARVLRVARLLVWS